MAAAAWARVCEHVVSQQRIEREGLRGRTGVRVPLLQRAQGGGQEQLGDVMCVGDAGGVCGGGATGGGEPEVRHVCALDLGQV